MPGSMKQVEAAVMKTRRGGSWKKSLLAHFCHGMAHFNRWQRAAPNSMQRRDQLSAGDEHRMLSHAEGGWAFKREPPQQQQPPWPGRKSHLGQETPRGANVDSGSLQWPREYGHQMFPTPGRAGASPRMAGVTRVA